MDAGAVSCTAHRSATEPGKAIRAIPANRSFQWSNLPAGALMNRRGLPAYPFRTDAWPLMPHQSTGSYEVDAK